MIASHSSLILFISAALLLLVIPGPAVFYILGRSIGQGRGAGFVSALGISVGSLVHTIAGAVGLSALLMSSALAFGVVKFLGAAYLIYLGVQKLRRGDSIQVSGEVPRVKLSRIFAQGIVVNVLNPKAALLFFAFLPQFVDPIAATSRLKFSSSASFLRSWVSPVIACGRSLPGPWRTGCEATPAGSAPSASKRRNADFAGRSDRVRRLLRQEIACPGTIRSTAVASSSRRWRARESPACRADRALALPAST
jgi:threonine/homoserine/homoserine lactone efflux protein